MNSESEIEKAINGDREAFINCIKKLDSNLYKIAKAMLKDDEEVGDAIQETILQAFKSLNKLKEPKYFKTWIIRILINKCKDIIRAKSKTVLVDSTLKIMDKGIYEEGYDNVDAQDMLSRLPENYRIALVLFYLEDMSVKDIANTLKASEGTVKSWLSRGRSQLKSLLEDSKGGLCYEG
ncbi:sigma-70 family RNA polymerase sigma factor [Clostridium sp. 'White wine YQ']|uniref:sigma-70 family RNA polymerase sigma factor n=1 Tax=Clostridium sp. 'White wine YQ' TaxID=3027474 RepID=UPI0023650FDC|nr:sigma-70 family RNA polymerase sigma factor [Clostridium sp. 'White wine YQ']MDD7796118.1 sigma-70 family RNA polymerase sigma factor [Clostridium sp. 'White wine YQ']